MISSTRDEFTKDVHPKVQQLVNRGLSEILANVARVDLATVVRYAENPHLHVSLSELLALDDACDVIIKPPTNCIHCED